MAPSVWGYSRIITGTVLGGILGFYVMHRVETSYKEKMKEQLAKYEAEMNRKAELDQQKFLKEEIRTDKAEILSES
ncbi:ATP-dependent helicase/nuclease subunit A isoform 2 [Rhynchospora pubera]|uniref:Uncharacterized protein n=2 Tax=Rhynchospora TaxID=46332 RepID=A0A9Q0HLI1_9POAL|nr:hypothetical protein LUZ63_014871 [Rhynchospora breviuscula]KAJ4770297.1 ATP-dependent helicase/nuclease subunit A isoform 2 [Rhynchospora pubera]KAJ4781753.1 ATP-dependent helicase/nuclease subunit A isoform 2 [Rhynchospora pubera]KAJ4788664.1 ATP-dependent helicase/nuclease subunit A isoform 2 [Rhynchospora pubera]KAJ4808191.1 ATP-dependent helicase/nuclease subunit A isoform 2 [Rhynchospora pubera]